MTRTAHSRAQLPLRRCCLIRLLAPNRAAGSIVESFTSSVTRATFREVFAGTAKSRGDVAPNPNLPAVTANGWLRYFEWQHGSLQQNGLPQTGMQQNVDRTSQRGTGGRDGGARHDVERGLSAYRAFYDVLPVEWSAMTQLIDQPYEHDAAGQSFAKSRTEVNAQLAASFRARRIDAVVYSTMPFGAPLALEAWPDVRTTLGYGNWLELPEVSVPAGYRTNGMPAGNLSCMGVPGTDAKLLAYAHAYEHHSRRFVPPPTPG